MENLFAILRTHIQWLDHHFIVSKSGSLLFCVSYLCCSIHFVGWSLLSRLLPWFSSILREMSREVVPFCGKKVSQSFPLKQLGMFAVYWRHANKDKLNKSTVKTYMSIRRPCGYLAAQQPVHNVIALPPHWWILPAPPIPQEMRSIICLHTILMI